MQAKTLDPKNVGSRLYNQVAVLLEQLETTEDVSIKERYMALVAIARIQVIFQAIRLKEAKVDDGTAGSAVRKYSTAFAAHDARRRKTGTGSTTDDADLEALIADDEDRDAAS